MPEEPVKIEVRRKAEKYEITITTDIRLECGYCELLVDDKSYGQKTFYEEYVLSLDVGMHSFTVRHWDIVDKPYIIQEMSGSFELSPTGKIILSDDIYPLGKLENQLRTILIADFPVQPCRVHIESIPTNLEVYYSEKYIGFTPCEVLANYREHNDIIIDGEPVPFSLEWNRERRKWEVDEVLGIIEEWDTKDESNKGLTLMLTMPPHRGKVVIEESKIPKEIYLETPSIFSFAVYNMGKLPSRYRIWLQFSGIDIPRQYNFFSEWCSETETGDTVFVDVEVTTPSNALLPDKEEAVYEISTVLEAM